MQNDLTESVQASIRPGEMADMYYYGESNLAKQAYPTVVNTRFVQAFTNLGQGSSQFIISPNGGVGDVIVQLTTAAGTYTNLALNQGWAYSAIARISVRYGSSAQYFFTGTQVYLQNLLDAENSQKCIDLTALGGAALAGSACAGATGYVYLKLPHNSIRANGKPLPFPSDLLVQPIVLTVELLAANAILTVQSGGGVVTGAPAAFASAQMQVKQEMLTDSSDQLARRVDMNSHAYTFPLMYFAQSEVTIPVSSAAGSTTVEATLTGFRAGEVRDIVLWLTPSGAAQTPASGSYNPLYWLAMNNLVLTYNGEQFSRFDAGSAQLWNLAGDEKSQSVSTSLQTVGSVAVVPTVMPWINAPFAQTNMAYDREMKLVHGKPILNAVVNVRFDVPAAATSYVLHAMYLYNASLLCSRGSAEYIF